MSDILDAATVRALLDYDPATGIFRWAVKTSNRRAGTLAGTLGRDGYVIICIKKRTYRAHRLAWLHITGSWPENQIDHKNRVRNDNRLCNLRDCSGTVNQHNSGLRSDNKSGLRGVSYNQKRQKWEVRMKLHGKLIHIGTSTRRSNADRSRRRFPTGMMVVTRTPRLRS
jgi:hypothetical protein